MQAAWLFVFLFLLAVCTDIPSVFGASITPYTEHEAVEVFKRQGSFGAYGSAGKGGWDAGVTGGRTWNDGRTSVGGSAGTTSAGGWNLGAKGSHSWNDGRTNVEGSAGYNKGGAWNLGAKGSHSWDNGKSSIEGGVGYDNQRGGSIGIGYRKQFRK